jgi:hypothetical protein
MTPKHPPGPPMTLGNQPKLARIKRAPSHLRRGSVSQVQPDEVTVERECQVARSHRLRLWRHSLCDRAHIGGN